MENNSSCCRLLAIGYRIASYKSNADFCSTTSILAHLSWGYKSPRRFVIRTPNWGEGHAPARTPGRRDVSRRGTEAWRLALEASHPLSLAPGGGKGRLPSCPKLRASVPARGTTPGTADARECVSPDDLESLDSFLVGLRPRIG